MLTTKPSLKKHVKQYHGKDCPGMFSDESVTPEMKDWLRSVLEACPLCQLAFESVADKLAHMAEAHPQANASPNNPHK